MIIVGLVSSWRESAPLLEAAVRSALAGCDRVLVLDAPVAGAEEVAYVHDSPPEVFRKLKGVTVRAPLHIYRDDADKRNALLRWARDEKAEWGDAKAEWALWVDGDELLIWGEHLRAYCARAQTDTAVGGFPLRIVEHDGSVALAHGRVFRPAAVEAFLVGASTAQLRGGQIVQLLNEKVCRAGGVPWGNVPMEQAPDGTIRQVAPDSTAMEVFLAKHRPPVAGEPHILHRSFLRDPARGVQAQHLAEGEAFDELLQKDGGNGS